MQFTVHIRHLLNSDRGLRSQSGQIGVIILLMMVVILTAGLSLASRTSQNLFLTTQQTESTRVFNAAEAGVEEAISSSLEFEGTATSGGIDDFSGTGIDVNYDVTKVNELETRIFEMVSVQVDLTGSQDGNVAQVDWSHEGNCASQPVASMVAAIYYQDGEDTKVRYQAMGGCERGDGFIIAQTISDDGYNRRENIPLQTGDLFMRLRSVYGDTHVRVAPVGWVMPTQYYRVRSEANNPFGDETRIVEVNRTLSSAPSVMDFVLISGNTIAK